MSTVVDKDVWIEGVWLSQRGHFFARTQFSWWKWWNPGSTGNVILCHMEMLDTGASDDIGGLGIHSAICLQIVYSWAQAIGQPYAYSISRYSRAQNMSLDASGYSHHSESFIWDDLASVITSLCPLSICSTLI